MLDNALPDDSVNGAAEKPVLWGAEEIGRVIGRTPRQTHHLLTTGKIKSAQKVGGRWVAGRGALREFGA
jgi:hypothetical protein